jgi:hypothetical protein
MASRRVVEERRAPGSPPRLDQCLRSRPGAQRGDPGASVLDSELRRHQHRTCRIANEVFPELKEILAAQRRAAEQYATHRKAACAKANAGPEAPGK